MGKFCISMAAWVLVFNGIDLSQIGIGVMPSGLQLELNYF